MMKKIEHIIVIIALIIFQFGFAIAASEQGNRGPLYLSTAWNLTKGDLAIQASTRFYFNNKTFGTANNLPNAVTFWDIQGGLNFSYGIHEHYQLSIAQILYQDNHKPGKGYNFPDDMFLKFKAASFPRSATPYKLGAAITTRIPLAKYHNVHLEPYSAGRIEFGILGLASYSKNPLYPEDSFNAHLNLGFIDHNDRGKKFIDARIPYINQSHSRELYGGVAAIYPVSNFDFSIELYGNYHVIKPPQAAFSRHNYLYISPGVSYNSSYWLSVVCSFDFRLSPHQSSKSYWLQNFSAMLLPTYPTWRVNLSFRMNPVSKLKGRFESKERDQAIQSTPAQKSVIQQISEERKEIENAEEELKRIREERKKMDEILNRLRKALEIKETKEKEKN